MGRRHPAPPSFLLNTRSYKNAPSSPEPYRSLSEPWELPACISISWYCAACTRDASRWHSARPCSASCSGSVLVFHTLRPFTGSLRVFIQLVIAGIVVIEALELPLNVQGHHFIVEALMVQAGNAIAGQPTTPVSPGTLCIVIAISIGFFLLLINPTPSKKRQHEVDAICLTGLAVVLVSFTFLMSYVYGAPFLYGTPLIPIAAPTTLALTCIGIGLVAAAGPAAFPLRYFIGPSISARLLRTFLPVTLAIIIFESFLDITLPLFATARRALVVSITLVIFSVITGYVVIRVSRGLGMVLEAEERKRRETEGEIAHKNENLAAMNEELTATDEELRANLDELARREGELRESEEKYRSLFETMLEGFAYCRMIYDDEGSPVDFIYLMVNPAFDRIVGVKTVINRRASEVFPGIKDALPELFEIYGRVALTGRPESFDLDFKPLSKWLHLSVYSPEKKYFVAVFEDITGRRKAEKVLTLYKIFTENAHDVILFIRKRDGRIIEVNKAAVLTYGYTREELLGMTIFDLRASDRIEYVMGQMDTASDEGLVFTTLHRKKDGSELPVEVELGFDGRRGRAGPCLHHTRHHRTQKSRGSTGSPRVNSHPFGRCHLQQDAGGGRHQLERGCGENVRVHAGRGHREARLISRARGIR